MKVSRSIEGSILVAIILISSCTQAKSVKPDKRQNLLRNGLRERESPSQDAFPRVYTTLVVDPSINDEESAESVSELDLLEVLECNLRIEDEEDDRSYCRIAFLVHSELELRQLVTSTLPFRHKKKHTSRQAMILEFDRERTERLGQVKTPLVRPRTVADEYSTIENFSCYPDLAGTKVIMDDLVQQASLIPNLSVSLVDIGDSYLKTRNSTQGYDIWALEITGSGAQDTKDNDGKAVFMATAGIHPREYAPPALLTRWAQELVDAYGTDADITSLLDHTRICLVLQTNPDGRRLAETTESYRRKNLHNDESACCSSSSHGVDLNRNFPFRWGLNSGSSSNPCSETYRGSAPASEPETQAVIQYAESLFPASQRKADPNRDRAQPYEEETTSGIFLDVHSYGELVIWPWSYENTPTGNDEAFEAMVHKIRHFSGYEFSGPGMGFLYPASGATADWAYGALGAAGMSWELGKDFHQDCYYFENYVLPDNLPALTFLAKLAQAPYSMSKGPDIVSGTVQTSDPSGQGQSAITMHATANDAAFSSGPTSRQAIEEIRIFLDVHPLDRLPNGNPPPYLKLELSSSENTLAGTGSLHIGMQDWLESLPDLSSGSSLSRYEGVQHRTVYFQAKDSDGYLGPATAIWLDWQPQVDESSCQDSDGEFVLNNRAGVEEVHSCQWLSTNRVRWAWLCDRIEVASTCHATCAEACQTFS